MSGTDVYDASTINRHRATKAEMEERADFLIACAEEHGPVSVRGLYYQAEVAGLAGIGKTELSLSMSSLKPQPMPAFLSERQNALFKAGYVDERSG
jgi:hypothetical protein